MVGEQHFRLDHPCGVDELLGSHGVRLIAREEGDVNVFDFSHFRDVLGVGGDVDSQAIEGEDEAVVPSFGVEL